MAKNEKDYIVKNYQVNGNLNLQVYCAKSKALSIIDKFMYSQPFNRPDMYYINNQCCYMFEHFEVDASLFEEGKGSAYKRNVFISDKQIIQESNEIIKNSKINKNEISSCGTTSKTISQEASKLNLRNNFIRIFDSHYNNIEEYKKNIQTKTNKNYKKYKTIFIIEQTTEFGGWVYKNNQPTNLELFYCDFVLDKMKCAVNVDYFIFINKSDSGKCFTIIENGNFKKLSKHIFNFEKTKILFLNNVTTITSTIFIPKSMIKKGSKPNDN